MELTQEQLKIIATQTSSIIIGAAGTGKTTTLIAKVRKLIADGVKPESIYVAAFSYRSMLMLRHFLLTTIGKDAETVSVGTFRDFSLSVLQEQNKELPTIADHATIRRCLQQAVVETNFAGTMAEAEHVIRSFKAKARKPSENEKHYSLLLAFKNFMEKTGKIDRYDIVRKHIVGMRNDVYQPCPIKYLLVDNIQDATQIQFLWLFEHLKTGVNLTAFGDDDLCLFENDGAIGRAAFFDLEELENVSKFTLSENMRISKNIGESVFGIVKGLSDHIKKENQFSKTAKTKISFQQFDNIDKEFEHIITRIAELQKEKPDENIAILVRNDYQANRMSHVLKSVGVDHSCVSPSLWDMPGAIMVLDLLEVILNTASNAQLFNTLICLGLGRPLVESLAANGMVAKDWLKNGASLPEHIDLPASVLQEYGLLQRKLTGYYVAMSKGEVKPQELFKAVSYEIVVTLEGEEQRDALMAVEALMDIKGNPKAVLKQIRQFETPDMRYKVVVSPIREVRNWEFDWVFMPFASKDVYPYAGYKVLKSSMNHEKKIVYMALTRAKKGLDISSTGNISDILKKVEASVQQHT